MVEALDLISVIVPVYKVEPYLMRCIDSIRGQTYKNLEIIIVDDGSPDKCPKMCDQIREMDSRVKVIHKENGGLGFARNSGLDIATGSYVTFIDSDDWISETHIENLYRAVSESEADVGLGSFTSVSQNRLEKIQHIQVDQKEYTGNAIIDELVLGLIGPDINDKCDVRLQSSSCMNLYRMATIADNNLRFRSERVAVAEDLYFNIDFFCCAKRIIVTDEVGYYYFNNAMSISRKFDNKRFERTICSYYVLQEQISQYGLTGKVGYRADRSFLTKIRVALRHVVISELHLKKKIGKIREILNHKLVKDVLNRYPVETYIPAMRTLTKAMRRGNSGLVYCLIRFREFAKGTSWLRGMLKQIGIGN